MTIAKIATGEIEDTRYEQPNKVWADRAGVRAHTASTTPEERIATSRRGSNAVRRQEMSRSQDAAQDGVQDLRVVVFQEEGYWIAQCIEHDIGAQGKTYRDMVEHFALALALEIDESTNRHGEPFAGIDPAPAYFQGLWEKRSSTLMPIRDAEQAGPGYEMALVA